MDSKKIIMNILVIVACVAIVGACIFTYMKSKKAKEENNNQNMYSNLESISNEPIFTSENYPKVDGSTATKPLAKAFEENFTGQKDIEVEHSMTHESYENLVDGNCDLILVVEPSDDDIEYADEKGIELQYNKVVNEGFVFFVNSSNPVENLTLEEVQQIYSGEITNWKEVGGNDEKIVAYQRPINSGSQTAMLNLVMQDVQIKEAKTENIAESMFDIIDVISDYDNGSAAIGYSYYYFANTMYIGENVKMLQIDGVEPNNKTIKSEEYPILSAYYAVTRKKDKNENTEKLLSAMLSGRGQSVAEDAGYVPAN